jgi:hypothetical protein
MTDSDYIARLHHHLVNYKTSVLGVHESGFWGTPPRAYQHILPVGLRGLNIVSPLRETFWQEQQRLGWKLHKYFHHLSSSQALAFNLLFSIYPQIPLHMGATRRMLGLPINVSCQVEFERVLDIREGTNIDALISSADGTRTIIEIKLTERTFGTARADDRHLAKLNDVYRPLLAGRIAESCLEPTSFFRDYQLYRNLAQVRLGTTDRVLLLLPKARTQLWRHAVAWCNSELLGPLSGCVEAVALEDVVSALAEDFQGTHDADVAAEVSRKYIPAAG